MRTISRRRRRTRLRTTADPSAREVTNPARKGPTSFNETTLITSSRPRCTRPFFLTCSNSAGRVSLRFLGNANCLAGITIVDLSVVDLSRKAASHHRYSKSLSSRRRGTKDFTNDQIRRLRRRRSVDVDVRLRFGLGGGRRIDDCGVRLLLLRLSGRRIGYRRLLLLTSRQKRGNH